MSFNFYVTKYTIQIKFIKPVHSGHRSMTYILHYCLLGPINQTPDCILNPLKHNKTNVHSFIPKYDRKL